MAREDVLLDNDFDLIEEGNEWKEGESSETDVELMLYTDQGENAEFPFMGYGIFRRLKARENIVKNKRELEIMMELDGFENATINMNDGLKNLKIEL